MNLQLFESPRGELIPNAVICDEATQTYHCAKCPRCGNTTSTVFRVVDTKTMTRPHLCLKCEKAFLMPYHLGPVAESDGNG